MDSEKIHAFIYVHLYSTWTPGRYCCFACRNSIANPTDHINSRKHKRNAENYRHTDFRKFLITAASACIVPDHRHKHWSQSDNVYNPANDIQGELFLQILRSYGEAIEENSTLRNLKAKYQMVNVDIPEKTNEISGDKEECSTSSSDVFIQEDSAIEDRPVLENSFSDIGSSNEYETTESSAPEESKSSPTLETQTQGYTGQLLWGGSSCVFCDCG